MNRVRLQHEYHDAALKSIRISGDDLTFVADLNGHWNKQCSERAYLTFHNVKNVDALRTRLSIPSDESRIELADEIIGVMKLDKTKYRIDLHHAGAIEIDCRGISEI